MESPDILSSCNTNTAVSNDSGIKSQQKNREEITEMREQAVANLQKPNLPNVNVPEQIIICLDICYDSQSSLFRLGDGTTFTPFNMFKRVLDFFIHSKHAINKSTQFALVVLKDDEPCLLQSFTNNLKEIISVIDYLNPEESSSEKFDFRKIFQLLKQEVQLFESDEVNTILPPPYVIRMIVLYGRSNCVPHIPQDDPYFAFLKKQFYFYTDILLAHEEECALYKCEEIYDALQDLDNGYSYVFEVSRNATKIHDCIAKLLAHPLQRPLQKNTEYTFGL